MSIEPETVYQQNGYETRTRYLECLAEDYDLPLRVVVAIANVLGPTEDFDGLVTACQDAAEASWE